jgi:hypothetical protein
VIQSRRYGARAISKLRSGPAPIAVAWNRDRDDRGDFIEASIGEEVSWRNKKNAVFK